MVNERMKAKAVAVSSTPSLFLKCQGRRAKTAILVCLDILLVFIMVGTGKACLSRYEVS